MRMLFSALLASLLILLVLPFTTWAACPNPSNPQGIRESIDCAKDRIATPGGLVVNQTEAGLLENIIKWLLRLVALLALLALIWGGVMYIASFGNEDRAKTAKKIIMYAIVGLLVVMLSFAVILAIQTFFR